MTVIPVNDRFRVELDNYSWAVCQWKKRKSHPEGGQFEPIAWFPKLTQACQWLVRRELAESNAIGADAVIKAITRSTTRLEAAIKEAGISDSWAAAKRGDYEH